jgi:flavin-dependent dehydrogenase
MTELKLKNNSRIAIIGGGPAGVFAAHFIHKYLDEQNKKASITIFDGKDFLRPGPKGCNLCAGVLSDSLSQKLGAEGIVLPDSRIASRVEGYVLHVQGEQIRLSCCDNEIKPITTVFRGNGPRCSTFPDVISFDDYLLSWVQGKGIEVISQPVWDIKFPKDKMKPIHLVYGGKDNNNDFQADLVVGAFGINSFLSKKIQNGSFGYRPPSTLTTYQAEILLGKDEVRKNFDNTIHVFIPKSKMIRYASMIPKGDYISLTVIGKRDADKDIFSSLTDLGEVRDKIPFDKPVCFCFPRIAVSPARNPFSDRFVIVGDASFSRHYKNGIESAFVTAQLAAKTVAESGIDSASFFNSYVKNAKRQIISDNHYGRFLLKINDVITSSPLLTRAQIALINDDKKKEISKKLRFILWNMFTGNIPYREIYKSLFDFRMHISLILNVFKSAFMGRQRSRSKNKI